MKFFETAKKMERTIQDYYRDLSEKCVTNEGIKNILNMLVKDHEQHLEKFRQMENDQCAEMKQSNAYKESLDVFQKLQQDKESFSCDIDQLKMYRQAYDLLEKKLDFYWQGRKELDCKENQAILDSIIADEEHHKFVLYNIIEMVERPLTWLEDAEFYHLDKY